MEIPVKQFNYMELPGLLNYAAIRSRLKLREINDFLIKRDYYKLTNLMKLNKKQIEKKLANEKKESYSSKLFHKKKLQYFKRENKKSLSTIIKQEIIRANHTIQLSKKINDVFHNSHSQKFINKKILSSSYSYGTFNNNSFLEKNLPLTSRNDIKFNLCNSNNLTQREYNTKNLNLYFIKKQSSNEKKKPKKFKHKLTHQILDKSNNLKKNRTFITNLKPKLIYTSYGYFSDCPFQRPVNINLQKEINRYY